MVKLTTEGTMEMEFRFIILLIILLLLVYLWKCCWKITASGKRWVATNWPVLGMLPSLALNGNRVQDFMTEILEGNGGSFMFEGPWFSNMRFFCTSDPANVHYVLSKNFPNFQKGHEFRKIFEILGNGIFVAEYESWEKQRKAAVALMNRPGFHKFVAETTWKKAESGLVPVLERAWEEGMVVDLQELVQRLAFDCTCKIVVGIDPVSLCLELPHIPEEKAFACVEEALLQRHMLPESLWRLEKWLGIGSEKKLTEATELLDRFLSECISRRSKEYEEEVFKSKIGKDGEDEHDLELLASYMKEFSAKGDSHEPTISHETWKDTLLNLIFAGKDTISASLVWFFWLLATNPNEENKIWQEISTNLPVNEAGNWTFSDMQELKKLPYLHGAICESLRLFPPVGLQHKANVEADILPSGHRIRPGTKIVLCFYSMGRMESIWGDDCLEFKPGRWISEGRIKTEPSFKFTAFNAGPRSCVGKEISFIQLKIVAASVISRFKFRVVEGHPVSPSNSVILHMKNGLKVKVSEQA